MEASARERVEGPYRGVAVGLALGPAVALGFARFAYALLLPPMRTDLGWSYSLAGSMNSANALGYLAGALVAAASVRRWGARRVFVGALAATGVSLIGSGATTDVAWLLALRAASGVGGALVFIAGAVLSARFAATVPRRGEGFALTSYYAGPGLGIAVSGLVLPNLLAAGLDWRWGWWGLGAMSLLLMVPAAWAAARAAPDTAAGGRRAGRAFAPALTPAYAAYFLFAVGYFAYMTYSVALLVGRGAGTGVVSGFWTVLGMAAVLAPAVWGRPVARWEGGRALAVLLLIVAAGAALPVLFGGVPAVMLSAVLFGSSFLSVVAAVTSLIRRSLPPGEWDTSIAVFTVVFATGQILGPVLSGRLAEAGGGLEVGLGWSAGALVLGAVAAAAFGTRTSLDVSGGR